MSGFKLLAIRPMLNCNLNFLKNLEPNKLYQLYQDYTFKYVDDDNKKNVIKINHNSTVPDNFYKRKTE